MVIVDIILYTDLFELVELYSGDSLEMAGILVVQLGERDRIVAVEVSWDRALGVNRVILGKWA